MSKEKYNNKINKITAKNSGYLYFFAGSDGVFKTVNRDEEMERIKPMSIDEFKMAVNAFGTKDEVFICPAHIPTDTLPEKLKEQYDRAILDLFDRMTIVITTTTKIIEETGKDINYSLVFFSLSFMDNLSEKYKTHENVARVLNAIVDYHISDLANNVTTQYGGLKVDEIRYFKGRVQEYKKHFPKQYMQTIKENQEKILKILKKIFNYYIFSVKPGTYSVMLKPIESELYYIIDECIMDAKIKQKTRAQLEKIVKSTKRRCEYGR